MVVIEQQAVVNTVVALAVVEVWDIALVDPSVSEVP
jgi:hypothetical protein